MTIHSPLIKVAVLLACMGGSCAADEGPALVAVPSSSNAPVPANGAAKPAATTATNAAANAAMATSNAPQTGWPRTFKDGADEYAIHQPQINSWEGDKLHARSAVAVTKPGGKEPRLGVIWIEARTDVDKPTRIVTLDGLKVTKASFPQDEASATQYLEAIRKHVPTAAREVPLDLLEANLAANQAVKAADAVGVQNTPPRIIFATTPTLLVLIDGEPALRELKLPPPPVPATGTGAAATKAPAAKLMRVVNTRALILLDEVRGRHFLHAMNGWYSSAAPEGPWAAMPPQAVPPAIEAAKQALAKDPSVDLLNPQNPETAPKQKPVVLVSTKPAELIQMRGEPQYTRVPGTNLMYVSNTDSAVFKHLTKQQYFVLVSGRWFAAGSLEGPWAFVGGKDLPADFLKIPADGAKSNVLVSVPGTPQAREAVIANSIPQTAAVKISEAKLTLMYDGAPKFKPIEGIKGLQYAVNTALPVILIEGDKTYWCVQNGIWFTAKSATGPWAVATMIPAVIYTIPPSSPIHYVTYVRIYGTAPGIVYVGYTPGYMGTVVSTEGVVVYGTGYYYPAYVGTYWVGYPPTYGYGAGFSCGAVSGFAFGFAAGAWMGNCWSHPHWGPYHYHGHYHGGYYGHGHWGYSNVDINSSNIYRNARGGVTSVNRHYGYDWDENRSYASGRGSTFNPYSNKAGVGGYSGHYDYDNNEYKMNRAGATYDRDTNELRAAGSKVTGDVDEGTRTVKRAGAEYDRDTGVVKGGGSKTHVDDDGDIDRETGKFRYNTKTDTGVARKGDDLYVGKDDSVYRRTDEGWQQKTDDGWKPADVDPDRPTPTRDLEQQRQARQTGESRYNGYQQSNASRDRYAGTSQSRSGSSPSRSGTSPSRGGTSPSRSTPSARPSSPSRSGGYGGGGYSGGSRGGSRGGGGGRGGGRR